LSKQIKKSSPLKTKLEKYFSSFLFRWLRASDEKNYSISMPKEKALNCKYIDPNNLGYNRVLTIDIDWDIPIQDFIDRIPFPNAIVANPENGHVQIMYFLQSRVYVENSKIMYAYRMVKTTLNRILQGDFGFAGRLQKNPLHPAWNTTWFNNDPYYLSDLIEWSMQQELPPFESHYETDLSSRNETIFDALRKYAYIHNKDLTHENLESYAKYLNSLCHTFGTTIKSPLGDTELRSIIKSVWRFMQNRYTSEKGSTYTNEDRKRSIEKRVENKWRNIHLFIEYRKMKLSSKRIASILGVTERTIRNYALALRPDSSDSSSPSSKFSNLSNPIDSAPTLSSSTNHAKHHASSCSPLPPESVGITETVFHVFNNLLRIAGDITDMMPELEQNTS
jgi:hypothetical protein